MMTIELSIILSGGSLGLVFIWGDDWWLMVVSSNPDGQIFSQQFVVKIEPSIEKSDTSYIDDKGGGHV